MHEAMLLIGAGCAGGLAGGWGLGAGGWADPGGRKF